MEQINIENLLSKANPSAKMIDIKLVSDIIALYIEANENIKRNGAVCAHPRTGAPIENPYLKIREKQTSLLLKFRLIKIPNEIKSIL